MAGFESILASDWIQHVAKESVVKDDFFFYRFWQDEP